jgi:hypothetical protein
LQVRLAEVVAERDELREDIRKVFAMLNRVEPTHECRTLNQIVSHLISSRGIAEQERDELLAALKPLLEVCKPYWVLAQVKPSYDAARAAIAKVEGSK